MKSQSNLITKTIAIALNEKHPMNLGVNTPKQRIREKSRSDREIVT